MTDDMKQRIIDAAKRAVKRSHEDPDCIDRTEVETIVLSGLLRLIEEQEAKQVIKQTYHVMMNRDYENPVEVTRYDWLCPTCKSLLCRDIDVIDDNYHFCKVCGQAVKWE